MSRESTPKIQLFEVLSMDDEVNREFNNFFYKWDLIPLTNNDHKTGNIRVTDNDARAVINYGGAYNKDLKKFSEYLNYADDNKAYERAIFSIIDNVKSFQKLMINIRKVNRFIETQIALEDQHKQWNIVYYNDKLL